ncbi:MAG: exodeoxyribonuclease V subunit alpha [Gammaproteobacteria bacterium]|nr:exodeoxyribonuclease V subunit alpha [Gammaproteobacteria bacterium]
MNNLSAIKQMAAENRIEYCHYTLARFIQQSIPQATELCLWLAVLVNIEINRGNVCLDIASLYKKSQELGWNQNSALQISLHLTTSPIIGAEADVRPLVLFQQKLYLNRYYHNEKNIADSLLAMARNSHPVSAANLQLIDVLFEPSADIDYQKLAALVSARHQLSIISGGPGTGKTWTVSKILALLIQGNPQLHIKLAAPTGKAAARLSESINKLRPSLAIDEVLTRQIPQQAVTLHRLLGFHRYTHRPRYHRNNRLRCDVLVVDEASMIDQQMMAAICAALSDDCKLILLGDKDQLSSVEAGSVYADLSGGLQQSEFRRAQQDWIEQQLGYDLPLHTAGYALADQLVVLHKSHRFDDASGIGLLAKSVNRGDSKQALQLLSQATEAASIDWQQPPSHSLNQNYREQAELHYLPMTQAQTIAQAFAGFHRFQILAAVWNGPSGVDHINAIIEQFIKAKLGLVLHTPYYAGMPLMMSSNLYQYQVHNGDIGIVWPDDQGRNKVWFEQGAGEFRILSLSQLPAHKTAYAMTVHKSQGSEFNRVLLVLPETETAVATRELLYTGITRAAESVEIWATESQLKTVIENKTQRMSGLRERLAGPMLEG